MRRGFEDLVLLHLVVFGLEGGITNILCQWFEVVDLKNRIAGDTVRSATTRFVVVSQIVDLLGCSPATVSTVKRGTIGLLQVNLCT